MMLHQDFNQLVNSLDAAMVVLAVFSLLLNCLLLNMVRHFIKSIPGGKGVRFDTQLIIAMALAGMVASLGSLAMYGVRLIIGNAVVIESSSSYCAVSGFIDGVLSGQAGFIACLLAIERFFCVVMASSINPRRGWAALAIGSLALCLVFLANLVYGSYTIDPITTHCLPHGNSLVPRMARFAIGLQFLSPLLLLSSCYTIISLVCFIKSVFASKNRSVWTIIAVRALTVNLIYCICYGPAVALHALHLVTGTHLPGLNVTRQVTASLVLLVHTILALCFSKKLTK